MEIRPVFTSVIKLWRLDGTGEPLGVADSNPGKALGHAKKREAPAAAIGADAAPNSAIGVVANAYRQALAAYGGTVAESPTEAW